MKVLRWIYFAGGTVGWVGIVTQIWHRAGWALGAFSALWAFVSIVDWLERTMLAQWNMKRVVTYEEK